MKKALHLGLVLSTAALFLASCGQTTPSPTADGKTLNAQFIQPIDEEGGGGGGGGGTCCTPPALTVIPAGQNAHVVITLKNISSSNTEDVFGADEFYTVGGFVATKPDASRKGFAFTTTPPIDVNDGQTITLNKVIFDEVVPVGTDIIGDLQAYDEDAAKDWATVGPKFQTAVTNVTGAISNSGLPKAQLLSSAVNAGFAVLDASMSADKDDVLGNQGFAGVDTRNEGTFGYNMHMEKTGGFFQVSTWNDDLRYEVKVVATTNAVTF